MYRKNKRQSNKIKCNEAVIGETIEMKMRRLLRDKEPIKDLAPQVYTERKDGVRPEYDIRTDKFEVAADARDKVAEQRQQFKKAKEEGKIIKLDEKGQRVAVDKNPPSGENGGEATK